MLSRSSEAFTVPAGQVWACRSVGCSDFPRAVLSLCRLPRSLMYVLVLMGPLDAVLAEQVAVAAEGRQRNPPNLVAQGDRAWDHGIYLRGSCQGL